jgi:hypothetical protein
MAISILSTSAIDRSKPSVCRSGWWKEVAGFVETAFRFR